MAVVAITGSLASGKSAVLSLLKKKGVRVFDCDKVIRDYYRDKEGSVYKKIIKAFPEVKTSRGSVSRNKLSEIMYHDDHKKEILESIVHPFIIKDLLGRVKKAKAKDESFFAEVPLLFEKNLAQYFDYIILVLSSRKNIIERIMEKYMVSKKEAAGRLRHFLPNNEKKKRADFIVINDLEFKCLQKEVDLLWKKLKEK